MGRFRSFQIQTGCRIRPPESLFYPEPDGLPDEIDSTGVATGPGRDIILGALVNLDMNEGRPVFGINNNA
jgi:hypothetical protein